ncbi:MAG: hypothetical protein AB1345_13915, partial [Chloroflexota bacterium]
QGAGCPTFHEAASIFWLRSWTKEVGWPFWFESSFAVTDYQVGLFNALPLMKLDKNDFIEDFRSFFLLGVN